jgi:competence protein ComEC
MPGALFVHMRMAIIGFAIGVWWLQRQPALPDAGLLIGCTILLGLAMIAAMLLWPSPRGTRTRLAVRVLLVLLACTCGASWSVWRAEARLADQLPMAWESRDVLLTGVVDGLPRLMDGAVRFDLRVESAEAPVPGRIQLSWYPPRGAAAAVPSIRPGER